MSRVLLLVPSRTYRTHDFIAAAGTLGIEVVVGSEHRPALAHLMEGRHLRLDFRDIGRSTERVVRFATDHPLDAVVAVDDAGVLLAAAASAALSLPHNSVASVAATRDKARMRECCAAAGLLTPHFVKASIHDAPSVISRRIHYPAVVKPLDLSASQGVIKVDEGSGFAGVFNRVAAIVASCQHAADAGYVLIEDFVPGKEVAVEALLRRGRLEVLAMFDKPDPLDGPFFEETIYVTPSRLSIEHQRAIAEVTGRATQALGLSEGPIHAEVRINEQGAWILEVAARSIGGLCSRTLRFGSGISLEELILRHAAGLPMPAHDREGVAAGVMMLPIPAPGTLQKVDGQDAARQVTGIDGLVITIPPGERLTPLPEGDRYLGFMFARGETPAAVETSLRDAHSKLKVMIDG